MRNHTLSVLVMLVASVPCRVSSDGSKEDLISSISASPCAAAFESLSRKAYSENPDPDLTLELAEDARLWAKPGEKHSEKVYVTNNRDDALGMILLSHRETFIEGEPSHVQLVRELSPMSMNQLYPNETLEVEFHFAVPTFVNVGSRSKVSLIVQELVPSGSKTSEISFYFTVSDGDLAQFDQSLPQCGEFRTCADWELCKHTDMFNCNETFWHGEVLVRDSVTGTRLVVAEDADGVVADSLEYVEPIVVGSRKNVHVRASAECCKLGFHVEVFDVAGNMARCAVGQVSAAVSVANLAVLTALSLALTVIIM